MKKENKTKKIKVSVPVSGFLKSTKNSDDFFFNSDYLGKGIILIKRGNKLNDSFYAPFDGRLLKIVDQENTIILETEKKEVRIVYKFISDNEINFNFSKMTFRKGEKLLSTKNNKFLLSNYQMLIIIPNKYLKIYHLKFKKKILIFKKQKLFSLTIKK